MISAFFCKITQKFTLLFTFKNAEALRYKNGGIAYTLYTYFIIFTFNNNGIIYMKHQSVSISP